MEPSVEWRVWLIHLSRRYSRERHVGVGGMTCACIVVKRNLAYAIFHTLYNTLCQRAAFFMAASRSALNICPF
jgi:hypothetical protein